MGFYSQGKWSDLPWDRKFDLDLEKAGDHTDKMAGDELHHDLHREVIEAKLINLRLHEMVRRRLFWMTVVQVITALMVVALALRR